MNSIYTYILAPNTANNYAILEQAIQQYSDLVQESRIKSVYQKSEGDIVSAGGELLAPANPTALLHVKATTTELDFELLNSVEGARLYDKDTQPFNQYWL